MATSQNNRNWKFDFEKPQKRTFDFTKDDKDLLPHTSTPLGQKTSSHWYTKYMPWIFLGVLLISVFGYMIFFNSGNKLVKTPESENITIAEYSKLTTNTVVETIDDETASDNRNEFTDSLGNQSSEIVEASPTEDNSSMVSPLSPDETIVSDDVEEEAIKVIRGDYGLWPERKDKLGTKYQTIQSRVNELKREGVF